MNDWNETWFSIPFAEKNKKRTKRERSSNSSSTVQIGRNESELSERQKEVQLGIHEVLTIDFVFSPSYLMNGYNDRE